MANMPAIPSLHWSHNDKKNERPNKLRSVYLLIAWATRNYFIPQANCKNKTTWAVEEYCRQSDVLHFTSELAQQRMQTPTIMEMNRNAVYRKPNRSLAGLRSMSARSSESSFCVVLYEQLVEQDAWRHRHAVVRVIVCCMKRARWFSIKFIGKLEGLKFINIWSNICVYVVSDSNDF